MNWRDLFYFSKGERRALTVLLCLICISWITLLWKDEKPMPAAPETDAYRMIGEQASDPQPTATAKKTLPKASSFPSRKTVSPQQSKVIYPIGKSHLPGKSFQRTEKFTAGTVVELNAADTTCLKKVPGIGPAFARRIVKYRELLGGYSSVSQLAEVYGIDEERYASLVPWFEADTLLIRKLEVNSLSAAELRRHPYINYRQARVIEQLRKQKSRLSGWENLQLIEEFTEEDKRRLMPYLSFQ